MDPEYKTISRYAHFIQPQLIVWVLLTYSIGVGLARRLGNPLNWVNILLGAILGIFLLLMRNYLLAFFDHPKSPTCKLHRDDPLFVLLKGLDRQTILVIALTLLTAGALDTVLLMLRHAFTIPAIFLLGIAFLISFFSAVPPVQLDKRGYGEIAEAILICNLIPAIGYLLIKSDLQIILVMLTLPLTLLYMASKVVQELETYAFDQAHRIQSLVVRMDWLKAMQAHNYLVLLAFLFIGIFALLGQPWYLTWPMLLPMVIGIFQIIQILRIISGAPPRWKILKLTAAGTFVVMAYLISFTLWIS
jgi:1,4-dihydroxy-2-naphthoate octaprenyltransferase